MEKERIEIQVVPSRKKGMKKRATRAETTMTGYIVKLDKQEEKKQSRRKK